MPRQRPQACAAAGAATCRPVNPLSMALGAAAPTRPAAPVLRRAMGVAKAKVRARWLLGTVGLMVGVMVLVRKALGTAGTKAGVITTPAMLGMATSATGEVQENRPSPVAPRAPMTRSGDKRQKR